MIPRPCVGSDTPLSRDMPGRSLISGLCIAMAME